VLARHLRTPVDLIEEWEVDKLGLYLDALQTVLTAEASRTSGGARR